MGALVAEEHSTYGNAADWSGGSSSSKSSSRRGTLSAAELSTHGGAAEHSSGGRWSAAQGLLRLRAGPGRRKRSQWAALDSLLDRYAERHKRCLFDQKYKGQYVIVSMGDSFSGDWLRLSDAQFMFLRGLPAWEDFRAARPIPQRFFQPQQQRQRLSAKACGFLVGLMDVVSSPESVEHIKIIPHAMPSANHEAHPCEGA